MNLLNRAEAGAVKEKLIDFDTYIPFSQPTFLLVSNFDEIWIVIALPLLIN